MKRSVPAACRTLVLTALLVVAAFVAAAPAGAAGTLQCIGTYTGGSYQSVVVPAGQTCTLNGAKVWGDVVARTGASLNLGSDQLYGNVTATSTPAVFTLSYSNLYGDLAVTGATDHAQVCGTNFYGHVTMSNGAMSSWGATISGSHLYGDLLFSGNQTWYSNDVSTNTITGTVTYTDNNQYTYSPYTVGNGLRNNAIGGDLICLRNTPPPDYTGTTVWGTRSGQCASAP